MRPTMQVKVQVKRMFRCSKIKVGGEHGPLHSPFNFLQCLHILSTTKPGLLLKVSESRMVFYQNKMLLTI